MRTFHLVQGDALMLLNVQVDKFRRHASALSAVLAVCLSLAFAVPGLGADAVQPKPAGANIGGKEKVVFQVSDGDPKKWNLALNNIRNVQEALGKDKVEVELVVYGPGIDMLKAESVAGNRVNDAVADGAKVVACENTMEAQKLTKEDMLKSIGYVQAGVIELIKRQQQGYAYIRP
jgi:intracellular sulfur oxidation DsrE/DsrF family protein